MDCTQLLVTSGDLCIVSRVSQESIGSFVYSEPNNDYDKDYHYDLDDHVDDK